jgi:hypothetical protein
MPKSADWKPVHAAANKVERKLERALVRARARARANVNLSALTAALAAGDLRRALAAVGPTRDTLTPTAVMLSETVVRGAGIALGIARRRS